MPSALAEEGHQKPLKRTVFAIADLPDLTNDNGSQSVTLDFGLYDIQATATSVAAPNMNAFTDRLMGSIRREALDHFLLLSEKQVTRIIAEHVDYYNHRRPHQSIGRIPDSNRAIGRGQIRKQRILGGLHHLYFKSSA